MLGKKRGHSFGACPTGSDLEFSFEKEMDSYERILYGDVNVSSQRVCTGRVVAVQDEEGGVTHVAKETDEKEEEYAPQGGESVGEDKDEIGTSAASEEEDRRAK